jgi:outer membrane protein assembly factor BamE (lipoprotein component of BamABCDE complex)
MRKVIVLVLVVLFGIAMFSSCKTADCPAYSKADTQKVEQPS